MTHCSTCGRCIRFKPSGRGSGTAPADYLNHARECPRYGEPPDLRALVAWRIAAMTAAELRGLQHYTPGPADECWIWRGYIDPRGYGQMSHRYGKFWAHRAVYEDHVGPIAPGMQLDHVADRCSNKACVNPHHLEQVTHAENQRRAALARIGKSRKCGHPYVGGESDCRVCARERAARHRAAIKAGAITPRRIVCTDCGAEADNCAKGLCRRCYTRQYKQRQSAARARTVPVPVHSVAL